MHERDNRTLPITQQLKASCTHTLRNNAKRERGPVHSPLHLAWEEGATWEAQLNTTAKNKSTLGQGGQTALPGQLVAGIALLSSCASVKSSTYASFEHTIVNRLLEEKNDVSKRIPAAILLCLQLYGHV